MPLNTHPRPPPPSQHHHHDRRLSKSLPRPHDPVYAAHEPYYQSHAADSSSTTTSRSSQQQQQRTKKNTVGGVTDYPPRQGERQRIIMRSVSPFPIDGQVQKEHSVLVCHESAHAIVFRDLVRSGRRMIRRIEEDYEDEDLLLLPDDNDTEQNDDDDDDDVSSESSTTTANNNKNDSNKTCHTRQKTELHCKLSSSICAIASRTLKT